MDLLTQYIKGKVELHIILHYAQYYTEIYLAKEEYTLQMTSPTSNQGGKEDGGKNEGPVNEGLHLQL